jgi:hypothetical protein
MFAYGDSSIIMIVQALTAVGNRAMFVVTLGDIEVSNWCHRDGKSLNHDSLRSSS